MNPDKKPRDSRVADQAAHPSAAVRFWEGGSLKTWLWALAVPWTLFVATVLWWNMAHISRTIEHLAQVAARSSLEKDIVFRQWANLHGEVYVPVTARTPPNPYLIDIPERDITTPSGRQLTLMNRDFMTRQVHELGQGLFQHRGHITSLKPIRPENAPDDWERQGLQAFEQGVVEISSVEVIAGEPHLRLMRPLRTTASCLRCHAVQGYKEGDIRGGISVAVPIRDYAAGVQSHHRAELFAHGGVWGLGLVALGAGALLLRRRRHERGRAEESRRESEERWRTIVENEPECVKVLDREGRLLEMNPAGLAMMQATSDQVLGQKAVGLVAVEDQTAFNEMVAAVFRGETRHLVFDMIGLKGRRLTLETTSVPLKDSGSAGGVKACLGVTRDITDRKRAEEVLQEANRLLGESQRLALLGRYVFHIPTGRWESSALLDEIFGFTEAAAEHPVERWLEIIHPDDRQSMLGYLQQHVLEGRHDFDRQYRIVRLNDQKERWVHGHGRLLLDPAGNPLQLVGVIQDITAAKRLEEQLRQSQKIEAVGQLAGGVAHDFNNILAAMMMNLEFLQGNPNLDQETREGLKELMKGSQRAAGLTRQLLMFSRRSVLEIQVLDLNDVVANLLKMLGRLLGEHIALVFERRSTLPAVEADAGMLEQVLMNLMVNARDAMPQQGGRIIIATEALEIDPERVAAKNPGARVQRRFVRLSVSDTGCGIDAALLERVFEPFFTTKEAGKGTGLGLATAYGIVAQHGGWMEVESQVGRGTTFRVYLPASTKTVVATEEKDSQVIPRGQETLLIVEDDPSIRRIAGLTLRALGYQVIEAVNGQEAMTLWQKYGREVDLLLTDMVMPEGMTGLELAERVRVEKPGLPVIIVSGYSAEITQFGTPTADGIVYLPKPFDMSVLSQILRRMLDRSRTPL